MKRATLAITLLAVLGGCTHTRGLEGQPWSQINAQAGRSEATVELASGERVAARSLHLAPDVATWVDPASGDLRSVPTADVVAVRFADRQRGALEGAGIGLAAGAIVGGTVGGFAALREAGYFPREGNPDDTAVLVGAGAGGLVGAALGSLLGAARRSHVVHPLPAASGRGR